MKFEVNNTTIEFLIGKKDEYENPNAKIEENILKEYIRNFDYELSIVHNSKSYTTIQYHNVDILRLHYSDLSKWINIFIVPKYKDKYIDNPLFSENDNFNRISWFARINSIEDLDLFIDIIKEDLVFRDEID